MTRQLKGIDHVHVNVADRVSAETWYASVLGLKRVESLAQWATDEGPLMVADADRRVCLSLFERPATGGHATVAMRVDAGGFLAWRAHLESHLPQPPRLEDHQLA